MCCLIYDAVVGQGFLVGLGGGWVRPYIIIHVIQKHLENLPNVKDRIPQRPLPRIQQCDGIIISHLNLVR